MELKTYHHQETHVGNVRENNEDSAAIKQTINGHVFIVCDGMGGAAEGKKASSIAVASLIEFFEKEYYENIQIALHKSLEFANEQIYATAQAFPDFEGMGTTACVLIIRETDVYFAHVGDSRIYLKSKTLLYQLTRDDSYVNHLIAQNIITIEEAKTHPDKNRILKALGTSASVVPTVVAKAAHLQSGDILLIATDGLTDMLDDTRINDILSETDTLDNKGKKLVQEALDNGGMDNVTFQLIHILESPHQESLFIDKSMVPPQKNDEVNMDATFPQQKPFDKKKVALGILFLIGLTILIAKLFLYDTGEILINESEIINKNLLENEDEILLENEVIEIDSLNTKTAE